MIRLCFQVEGDPIPQGSARAFVVKGRAVVTSDNPRLKAWRNLVAAAASAARIEQGWPAKVDHPLVVSIVFVLPRPKTVKRERPTGAKEGDIDKLARAVLDALTEGEVVVDDSRVVRVVAEKVYGPTVGITVAVESLAAGDFLAVLKGER